MTTKTVSVRFTDGDMEVLEEAKKRWKIESTVEMIRFALRQCSQKYELGPKPAVSPETKKGVDQTGTKVEWEAENPYLLIGEGWSHEMGEKTRDIKQQFKPWAVKTLWESDPEYRRYSVMGKGPQEVEEDDTSIEPI